MDELVNYGLIIGKIVSAFDIRKSIHRQLIKGQAESKFDRLLEFEERK